MFFDAACRKHRKRRRADAGGRTSATAITPQAALTRLLASPLIVPEWLAPSFTNQIPAARLETDIKQYEEALGAFVRVAGDGRDGVYLAIFEGGTLPALVALDDRGCIVELLFRAPQTYSVDGALAELRTLPGQVGYVVKRTAKKSPAPDKIASSPPVRRDCPS